MIIHQVSPKCYTPTQQLFGNTNRSTTSTTIRIRRSFALPSPSSSTACTSNTTLTRIPTSTTSASRIGVRRRLLLLIAANGLTFPFVSFCGGRPYDHALVDQLETVQHSFLLVHAPSVLLDSINSSGVGGMVADASVAQVRSRRFLHDWVVGLHYVLCLVFALME